MSAVVIENRRPMSSHSMLSQLAAGCTFEAF